MRLVSVWRVAFAVAVVLWLCSSVLLASDQSTPPERGRDVREFLTPDGRFDLEAARAAGYQGPLSLDGIRAWRDGQSGEPRFAPKAPTGPDDQYWREGFGLPGLSLYAYAAAVYQGKLIVGGSFQTAGTAAARGVAAWDGVQWSALGAGVEGTVWALTVYGSLLVVGGDIYQAGGSPVNRVAAWNGSAWLQLGTGVDGVIYALTVFDGSALRQARNCPTQAARRADPAKRRPGSHRSVAGRVVRPALGDASLGGPSPLAFPEPTKQAREDTDTLAAAEKLEGGLPQFPRGWLWRRVWWLLRDGIQKLCITGLTSRSGLHGKAG